MRSLVFIGPLLLVPSVVTAQLTSPQSEESPKNDSVQLRTAKSAEMANSEVGKYVFFLGTDREKSLKLYPKPILRFTNPVVGEFYSNVFVWTRNGRPEVVASIINWYAPTQRFGGEFQSLSSGSLTAVRSGKTVWEPETPGVDLKPVDGANSPSNSPVTRLRQMLALAREFKVEAKTTADRSNVPKKLRLLPRAIFRYESTDPRVLDGAIFAFVRGTDPELLLLIEARRMEGKAVWHFAPARMNSIEFRLLHKSREVWSVPQIAPPWIDVQDRSKPYMLFPRLELPMKTNGLPVKANSE